MAEDKSTSQEGPSDEDVREEAKPERCPKCGTMITNDEVETCPKCGADLVPPAGVKAGRVIAIIVLILLAVGLAVALWKL